MDSRSTERYYLGQSWEGYPRLEDRYRLKFLVHKFLGIASRAAESEECSILVDNVLESIRKQVEGKAPSNQCRAQATFEPPDGTFQTARLKKKDALISSTPIKR